MTRDEARKAAEVMLAYADGKEIQYFDSCYNEWHDIDEPSFDWDGKSDYYRIKPEPKYRPFKDAEECWQEMQKHQPFGWVKDNSNTLFRAVTLVCDNGMDSDGYRNFQYLFENYTFTDGTPFGIKEENYEYKKLKKKLMQSCKHLQRTRTQRRYRTVD